MTPNRAKQPITHTIQSVKLQIQAGICNTPCINIKPNKIPYGSNISVISNCSIVILLLNLFLNSRNWIHYSLSMILLCAGDLYIQNINALRTSSTLALDVPFTVRLASTLYAFSLSSVHIHKCVTCCCWYFSHERILLLIH